MWGHLVYVTQTSIVKLNLMYLARADQDINDNQVETTQDERWVNSLKNSNLPAIFIIFVLFEYFITFSIFTIRILSLLTNKDSRCENLSCSLNFFYDFWLCNLWQKLQICHILATMR